MCLLLQGHLDVLRRVTLDVVLKDLHPSLNISSSFSPSANTGHKRPAPRANEPHDSHWLPRVVLVRLHAFVGHLYPHLLFLKIRLRFALNQPIAKFVLYLLDMLKKLLGIVSTL
jgi:hypothetical protein